MSSCSAASRREDPPSTRAITRMRMSAEYAFGMARPPDESMPPDSPIYRSLGILRFYSARTCSSGGLIVLYTAFFSHGLLGFYALYRQRHLRMPANEAWQLALGLTIPFLLISHPVGIRLGEFQYGRELGYVPLLNKFWVVSPDFALPRQLLLLLLLLIHG